MVNNRATARSKPVTLLIPQSRKKLQPIVFKEIKLKHPVYHPASKKPLPVYIR
jgi:hypothetical protein